MIDYKIIGYKFNTINDAQIAIQNCNTYYGIPISPSSTTQNWVEYKTSELDNPVFYYINYLDSLQPVLGSPNEFYIKVP
jgi:hypothetical protein